MAADPLAEAWVKAVMASLDQPRVAHGPCSRIVNDFGVTIDYAALANTGLAFQDLGYTNAKYTQLKRNYWPEENIQAMVDKIASRERHDHSSAASPLGNGEKGDKRSQGHCMQSIVATKISGETHIDIYYRSTELIMKFLADLIFFAKQEQLHSLRPITFVRCRFANAGLSTVMLPILFRHMKRPMDFMEKVEANDEWFYRVCMGELKRFLNPNPHYTYRTRIKMIAYFNQHVAPQKVRALQALVSKFVDEIPEEETDDDD